MTLVSSGEGATSEGEFWEAMNAACLENLPLVFLIEDNGYAISVPVEKQTRGRQRVAAGGGLPESEARRSGRHGFRGVLSRADAKRRRTARARKGPALVHATVTRPYSHSLSDDERLYKTDGRARSRRSARSAAALSRVAGLGGHSGPARAAGDRARGGSGDPGSHRPGAARPIRRRRGRRCSICIPTRSIRRRRSSKPSRSSSGEPRTMVDEINLTLHEEMRRELSA